MLLLTSNFLPIRSRLMQFLVHWSFPGQFGVACFLLPCRFQHSTSLAAQSCGVFCSYVQSTSMHFLLRIWVRGRVRVKGLEPSFLGWLSPTGPHFRKLKVIWFLRWSAGICWEIPRPCLRVKLLWCYYSNWKFLVFLMQDARTDMSAKQKLLTKI